MKRFLLRTLLFLAPILLLAALGEYAVRRMPNSYRLKENWMASQAGRVETLILGNSHAYYGIRPHDLKGVAFNLANVSQVSAYDDALLRRYIPMPRLRQIFLVVDNSYLFDLPLEQTEPNRCAYYTIYMGVGPHSRCGRYGLEIIQFDGFCEKIKARLAGTYSICDSLGWGVDYKASLSSFDEEDTIAVMTALQKHICKDWRWEEENAKHVERIAAFCQQQGIRLIVVQTPVCASYYKRIPERQRLAIHHLMQKLQKTYGAIVHDYAADARFTGKDFFDADHLSDIGARKFTTILNQDFLLK